MPIYKLNGETYDIPNDVVADFEKDNPNATVTYFARGDEYEIPVSERNGFLTEFPDATTEKVTPGPGSTKQPMIDAMQKQAQASYQPTAQELAGFQQTINNAGFTAGSAVSSFDKKAANLQKRQGLNVPKRVNVGETNNLVEGDQKLNPETGKLEQTYITSQGNSYLNKGVAENEQRQIDDYDRRMRYATGQAMDELNSKYVNPLVDEALKRADDEWTKSMKESTSVPTGEGMEMFALRRANEKIDPDKILQGLQKTLENAYKSPEMQQEISRLADSIGMSKEEYLEQIVAPSLAARLENTFASSQIFKNMPKNATEYILQGLSNSIGGMLMGAATETKGQRAYKNQAEAMTEQGNNPYYQPGTAASLAKMGVSFAADAPFFGVYGRVSGQVAKNIAERQISKMVAEGLSETAARSVVGTALENSVGARMKNYIMQHVVGGALTMGAYNATSETARQIRDKEGFDLGQIAGSAVEGLAVGSAFGVTGGAVQALSQPLSGISKIGAKVAGFGAEAETMYATEELSKMAHGQEGFENPFEGSVEALMKLGVMKATGPDGLKKIAGEILHPIKSNQQQRTGIKFTDEEQAYVRNTQEGQKLIDALSQMHPGKSISEVNGKKKLTKEGEALRLQLSQNYEDFMNNQDIPANVKQKVAGVLGGVYRPGLETGADIIQNEDGTVLVKTRDKDGNCVQDLKFDNLAEAEQWRENHLSECKRNDAVNMWNSASEQTRQEIVNIVRDQISGKTILDEMMGMAEGMKQNRLKRQLEKINQVAEQYEGRELTDEEARNFIQMVIRDGDDATFNEIYQLIHDNAYPKDMPDSKRYYWEGQQLSNMEKHFAQADSQVAEERLMMQGEDFANEVLRDAQYPDEKIAELASRLVQGNISKEQFDAAVDYYNKIAKVNGMFDETLKDINNQVEAANAYVRRNTHTDSGSLIEAVYDKNPDRQYYVTAGHFEITPDGKMNPTDNSGMVILRDKISGEIEVVNPSDISVSHIDDPNRVIAENDSMEGLRGELMKQADDNIELHPDTPTDAANGDIYIGSDGKQYMAMQIQDEAGNSVWAKIVIDKDGNPVGNPMPFDMEEYRKAKSNEIDAASRPQEEILSPENNQIAQNQAENAQTGDNYAQNSPENIQSRNLDNAGAEASAENGTGADNAPAPALSRIPVDEKGKKIYEQAKPEDTLAELTEKYGEEKAQQMISQIAEGAEKDLEKLQKTDTSAITDMADLEAHEDKVAAAKHKADYWKNLIKPKEDPNTIAKIDEDIKTPLETEKETTAELDQEGKPFISAPNGTTTFGLIDSSKNLDEAPIKLSQGDKSHGYEHMELRHGKQIRGKGFKSIEDFVDFVAKNYTVIKEGVDAGGNPNGTYLLQAVDNHNNTLYIELSKDGSYWNVNSGGVFRKNYGDKLKTVWSASEVQNKESAPDNTSHPKPNADKADGSNGTVPNTVSGGKDTKNNNTLQENQQKNSKLYQKTVESNTGRSFTFTNGNGGTSVLNLQRIDHEGNAVVIRQDYDAQGNVIGEPREERYPFQKIGNAILTGTWKKKLNTDEELRQNYKYHNRKVGNVPIIDVLTDNEKEQIIDALRRVDKEAAGYLEGEFINQHREDIILRGRALRNEKVDKAFARSGRGERLRGVREQYNGYPDAESYLTDEAMQPQTIEEYVADALGNVPKMGNGFLAYTSYDQGGNQIVGLKDETGFGSRGFAGDTKGFNPWLAPNGKGISLKQFAESIHESLPEGMKQQYSDQDLRNIIWNVLTSAEKPTDIANYILRNRIDQAEAAARHIEEGWMDEPSFQKVYGGNSFASRLQRGKESVNTEPTEAQKEAGNYKKGHISFGGYDFTIENPEGSIRRGTDADGKQWEQKMNNTYGYILGKRGKDGDHLDMFINDKVDLDNWNGNVYVVDQVDPKTGKWDEHKILYGFNSEAEAREAYLSNYEKGWQGLGKITGVDKATFDKWLDSSDRKLKEFADHSIVKHKVERQMTNFDSALKDLNTRGISIDNQDLLDSYGLKNVVLSKTGNHITLTHFIVDQQGQGYGSRFMEDLARLADENGYTLALTPGLGFGAKSKKRLTDFYKRFGFVPNKGRNADFETREAMIRRPKEFMEKPENQEKVIRDAVVEFLKSKGIEVSTDWKIGQKILDDYNKKLEVSEEPEEAIKSQKVTDQQELDELNNGKTVKRYRAMQLIDGKLYPPMSAKVDGEMRQPTEIGVWEKAEERPDLIKNGKFVLNKGQKGQGNVPAAYNPYFHTSTSGLNDQFTSAYKRPELVVVEVEIPESELTSGYKAEGAKDAVGNVDWHSGVVNGQLPADRQRQVTLSRYSKVNRVVPDSEVADMIAKQLDGTNVEVPYNVVTPQLRKELEARGVKISDKPAGSVTEDINGNPIEKGAKYFKTGDGYAYGYTMGGKIYVDPRIATSETPIHEYGHLYCAMKRQTDPEGWNEWKQVMLNDEVAKPIIDRVKRDYPELAKAGKEDDFAEEIITQFSGKRGSERLREIAEEVAKEKGGVFGKAEAITAMQRLKSILNRFWEGVAKMMGWKYTNANQIADKIMADMLNGVDPTKIAKDNSGKLSSQAEIERTLMGVHNLSEDKLRKVLKQGGLANPSLAVVDTKNHMHTDYGEISLIPKSSLIASSTGRNAGTFTADAWTPTYPQVQRLMSDKGQSMFWKDIRSLNDEAGEVANHMRMAFDTWLDKETGQERLAYWYLRERGKNPELVLNKNPYGEDIVKRIDELTDNGNLEVSRLPEDQIKEIADMYHTYKESIGEPVTPAKERIEKLQARIDPEKQSPFTKLQQYRLDELKKYGELLHNLNDFEYAVRRSAFSDGKPNVEATVDKAAKAVKDQDLQQDFEKWLQEKADRYGVEEKLWNGTDSQGRNRYLPNTLENASKLMKKEGLNGAINWSSIGNWIAKVANKEKTLGGIRKNKKNLNTTKEEHEAFHEEWGQKLRAIAGKLGKGDWWSGDNILSDALDHYKNISSYLKREYNYDLSAEDRQTIEQFVKEVLTNFPTGYFETKFERPVYLNEFEIAVVPENTSPEVVEALKNAGLDVRTYDDTGTEDQKYANRKQATMDAVRGRDDIMFQMVGKEGAIAADKTDGNDERSRNLTLAEDSEKAGVDPKAIKLATGWERGADGQWRYEIPDADVDIIDKYNEKYSELAKKGIARPVPTIDLVDLLGKDNELFKYYPELKSMPVQFSETLGSGTSGSFDGNIIKLNAEETVRFDDKDLNNENIYGTLLHEIQHAIQDIEGFAKGGNLRTSTTEAGINAIIAKKEAEKIRIKTELDAINKILSSSPEEKKDYAELAGKTVDDYMFYLDMQAANMAQKYDRINSYIEKIRHDYAPSLTDAKDLYHSLAGEVEARNVTDRMNMTDEERRNSLASETEDVPREDQVIIMGDGTAMNINDIKPVGKGDFGEIYDQFKGKPKEAIDFLTKKRGGDVLGVFNRKEVGDIDLVWGYSPNPYKGKGLSHIIRKHIETLHDFKDIEELTSVLDDVVNNGEMGDDYAIEKDGYRVVIAKEKDGKRWILTAFDNNKKIKEKASITSLNTPSDVKGEGAVSPDASLSGDKDTKNINTLQENQQKSADEAPKFQRVGNPEPEMTSEERQYWNQWDAAMKKWKERNAIPADQTAAPEKPRYQRGESAIDYAQKLVQWNRMKSLWQTAPKLEDYRQVRDDKDIVESARQNEQRYPDSPSAKMRRVASDMMRIRHAMSRQKAYDKATVKAVTDFAHEFMKLGFGDNLSRGEIERMLSSVKNATGAKDIKKNVDNIMNILIDNHLRNLDQRVQKLSSTKELSKTAQGVEKQGRLELKGQRMIQAFRDAREKQMTLEQINERMADVAEKMNRSDDEAPMWEQDYEGLAIARQYVENIEGSRQEWADLDTLYKDAVKDYKTSGRSYKDQQEYLESLEQAMQENKIERIGYFGDVIGRLEGNIAESMQGAKEFVEREKKRTKHIQDMANFDLAGKDMGTMREKVKGKPANFFLQPLGTFEQMLKQFGSRNANGEGYLYDYFMRNWMDATDKAFTNEQKAKEELDAKAREVFGGKVKRWSDLYDISRSLPTLDVEVLDGEEPKTFKLTQGNLLYIYMADKMIDGRMKLRKMGIDEEKVEQIKDFMDPRLVQLGDWLQGEYLPQKRTEYNKVHERMFGAPMAAIDNYFPLKVLGDARYQEQDVNVPDSETLPSTITGNIIKRRKNALPLDILHTDALSLAIEHVEDMERWAAQAEWNKDINTLLSYTTFRNKVKNMDTIYGSGDALWNSFKDAAKMAAGTYNPSAKSGHVDAAISNIAKGVTAAKINFRVYTAFKQLLSAPAFLHDVNLADFAHDAVNPYGSWKWAMENMPVFQKRWKSRQVGDTRLMDDPTDWKLWKNNVVQMATRLGMTPNALVDGVTCAVGARSIYKSRYKKYKDIGASDEVAHKRALQDAEIGYNLTQQSSEGAFVSTIQKDRTVAANMLSVFRNSSMAYTRQWVDAARNLRKRAQKGYKEDSIKFMTRQMQDQFGIDEDQAKRAAELEYAREGRRDVARMLNMMFGVTIAWNLGASLPYLLIGDDDHTKKEMLTDALMKGLLAGPTEGLAAGNLYSDFIGRTLANEQTRNTFKEEGLGSALDNALKQGGDYEVNPLPLMADIQSMIKKMGYDKYAAAQDVFNICMQSAVGVNPQTFTDMWNAAMDYGAPGWDGRSYYPDDENLTRPKELALFMMRLMNAPTSSWRNKYIDELGMNAEDAKKLPYEEMAKRYANYKHWKDAPLMGWLRSDEERQKKMESIQKKFDKAVEERMARLTDKELMHNVARSGSAEEKRRYAKMIAQRLGVTPGDDSQKAGKDKWYQNLYQQKMSYEDIREDEMLADKYKNLENYFKEKREEAERKSVQDLKEFNQANKEWKDRIDEAKKEAGNRIDWIRGGKWNTPSGKKGSSKKAELLAPGKKQLETSDDEEAIMKNIRQWRKEALEILLRAEAQ